MDHGFQNWGQPQAYNWYYPNWGTAPVYTNTMYPQHYSSMFDHNATSTSASMPQPSNFGPVDGHVNMPSTSGLQKQQMQGPKSNRPNGQVDIDYNNVTETANSQGSNSSDSEDMDIEEDKDLVVNEVDKSTISGKLKEYREGHIVLGDMFKGNFYSKVQNLPYYKNPQGSDSKAYFKTPTKVPLLRIAPDLEGSWFDPPDKEDPSDATSYWKSSTKFPNKTRITPSDYSLKAPPKNPYIHIEDENLRLMLEAPIFNSISLDHSAFNVASVEVPRNPHTTLDALIRSSMLDNFTIDEYLKLLIELVPKISLDTTSQQERLRLLDLTMDVIIMVAEGNQRSGQTQIATYVSNKLALRDVVLNKFTSQNTSRNILRGSTFLSPNLFGGLPESFKNSLKLQSNKELRFTKKPFASAYKSSSGFKNARFETRPKKRPANFLPTPSNKRFKGSWNSNRTPFSRQQFFRAKNQRKN